MKRVVLFGLIIGAMLIMAALPALAGSATITGYLSDANLFPNGRFYSGNPCGSGLDSSGTFYYQFRQIQVTVTGIYIYTDYGVQVDNDGIIDAYVGFYTGDASSFDPTDPYGNGCTAVFDDSGAVTLNAGVTYTLVVSSYEGALDINDGDTNVGNYQFSLDGPGDVNVLGSGACTNPLPGGAAIHSIPNGAPAFWGASLSDGTGFNIPAGTWWTYGTSGDFTHVWIACEANSVWVPSNAVSP